MIIEKTIYDYLSENLDTPVYYEDKDIDEFVLIEKLGTTSRNFINTVTISFACFSDSFYGAMVLDDEVRNLVPEITTVTDVFGVRLNDCSNFTDTEKKRYCQYSSFDISYKD